MGRFNWKLDQMGIDEKLGWDLWEHSSYLYFRVSYPLNFKFPVFLIKALACM